MVESSEAFEAYAAEFQSLLKTASSTYSNQQDAATLEENSSARTIVDQCHDLLQQLAVEARGVPDPQVKRELLDRHRAYKSQWQAAKQEVDRAGLMASSSSKERQQQQSGGGAAPTKLRDAQDALARQNATLAQASRTIQETEEVATEIAGHLSENRDTLERCSANTKEVGTMAARANQIATNLLKPWWRKGI